MRFNQSMIDGIYNYVPEEMLDEQRRLCRFCAYRFYNLKLEIAEYESQIKGGSAKDYLDLSIDLYKTEMNPKCNGKGCLLAKLNEDKQVVLSFKETLLNKKQFSNEGEK